MTDTSPPVARGPLAARALSKERAVHEAELRELLDEIARGDQAAMARLYDATHRLVHALVVRVVGERDAADEVLLDVFMQVWRRASTFDGQRGQVSTWLLTIARSRALDRRRTLSARARREEAWSEVVEDDAADCSCGCEPGAERERAELCDSVRGALQTLPPAQRRAMELAFYGGLSHTEIAERLAEPLGTVKTRIRLGMLKLREALEHWEEAS